MVSEKRASESATEPYISAEIGQAVQELSIILAKLRTKGGCDWCHEQTHTSLVKYLVEETYELVDAIQAGDRAAMREELGDVLYQVVFHCDIAAHDERDPFTLADVAEDMAAKMRGRHPSVFSDAPTADATSDAAPSAIPNGDALAAWEALKAREKPERTSILDGIPRTLPALALAEKMLGRAERKRLPLVGSSSEVSRINRDRRGNATAPDNDEELGETLLAMVDAARKKGLDAEHALRAALARLEEKIRDMEQ